MLISELIQKKVSKQELSKQEIDFFVSGYTNGSIPDYQMSAFLMAIVFNGMTIKETTSLTMAMVNSGEVIDLSEIPGIKTDKHSTGGVGDKISLALAPIIAACGIPMAKMSGRGLGFTGGTIDKLESIPGFKTEKTIKEFIELVKKNNLAIISQTENIVPADKKIYALRDVTGTVSSIPLIASSIMSKKIATGSDTILLDVKVGDAAFMKNIKEAEELGLTMIKIGKELGKDVKVEITSMSKPLGRAIGNRNEVIEAMEALKGFGSNDFMEVLISSASIILEQAKVAKGEQAKKMVQKVIDNGLALQKFKDFISAQDGDINSLESKNFLKANKVIKIYSEKEGYVEIISSLDLGFIAMELGAGRKTKEENIDPVAGIYINKKTNEFVSKGDVVYTIQSNNIIKEKTINNLKKTFKINKEKIKNKIIIGKIN
ncbi:MAG: thymidine phosphorylase [Mycoplasma sp.]|nr:thymidine phosphorylase [Mycoplasma sp.]